MNAQTWDWAKSIGYGAQDRAASIGTDQQGNIYVTGSTSYMGGGGGSYCYAMLWKFDNSGNMLWADTTGIGEKSVTDDNGFTYIAGGNKIGKYNSAGQKIWIVTVPIAAYFQNISLNLAGGVVVAGSAIISNASTGILYRYDENGNYLWSKLGEFPCGGSTPFALTCDKNGNSYIAGGDGDSVSTAHNFGFLVKYNSSGVLLSRRTIPHTPNDIVIDNKNNIYVTGWYGNAYPIYINNNIYYSGSNSEVHQYLVKYDQSGIVLWYKVITGITGEDAIATDEKGNVYLTIDYNTLNVDNINLSSTYVDSYDIIVMKADSAGNILWFENSMATNTPAAVNMPKDIIVNSAGGVLIAGGIIGTHLFGSTTVTSMSYTGLLIAKINQPSAAAVSNPNIKPSEFHVYPNPTSGVFQITYSSTEKSNIQLTIIDSKGQTIYAETISQFQGEYNKAVDLSKRAKGVYSVEIISNGKKSVKRIVLN